jgi:integrase
MNRKDELKRKKVEPGISKTSIRGKTEYFVRVSRRTPGPKSRRIYRQGHTATLLQARRLREDFLIALKAAAEKKACPTVGEYLPDYLRHLEAQRRASTVFRQRSIIQAQILPTLRDRPLDEISVQELEDLIDKVCAGKSTQTKKHFISYLSDIFARALKKGLIVFNPVDRIDRPKIVKKDQLFLSEEEARKLLTYLRENYKLMFQHVALAIYTMCRAGELRALTWADIDWHGRQITVNKTRDAKTGLKLGTKNFESRKVPINNELLAILEELRRETFSSPSEPILPHWREFASGEQGKPLKLICQSLQLPPIRFHDLRATGITLLLLKGVALTRVMLVAGHKRISSTNIYLRASGREAEGATDCLQLLEESSTQNVAVQNPNNLEKKATAAVTEELVDQTED